MYIYRTIKCLKRLQKRSIDDNLRQLVLIRQDRQARNQDFMWGGANEAKADPTTEMYFLSSDPFI